MKDTNFCPQFSPQNTENRIIAFYGIEISPFSGHVPNTPPPPLPRKRGLMAPFWYSQLLYSNLLATSIFIETPAETEILQNAQL